MGNENKQVAKPISVAKTEFAKNIAQAINESGLPLFISSYILRDILTEVQQQAIQQEKIEEEEYKKNLKELENKNENTNSQ